MLSLLVPSKASRPFLKLSEVASIVQYLIRGVSLKNYWSSSSTRTIYSCLNILILYRDPVTLK